MNLFDRARGLFRRAARGGDDRGPGPGPAAGPAAGPFEELAAPDVSVELIRQRWLEQDMLGPEVTEREGARKQAKRLEQEVFHAYDLDNTPRGFIHPDSGGDEWGFDDYSDLVERNESALREHLLANPELEHDPDFRPYYEAYREEQGADTQLIDPESAAMSGVDRPVPFSTTWRSAVYYSSHFDSDDLHQNLADVAFREFGPDSEAKARSWVETVLRDAEEHRPVQTGDGPQLRPQGKYFARIERGQYYQHLAGGEMWHSDPQTPPASEATIAADGTVTWSTPSFHGFTLADGDFLTSSKSRVFSTAITSKWTNTLPTLTPISPSEANQLIGAPGWSVSILSDQDWDRAAFPKDQGNAAIQLIEQRLRDYVDERPVGAPFHHAFLTPGTWEDTTDRPWFGPASVMTDEHGPRYRATIDAQGAITWTKELGRDPNLDSLLNLDSALGLDLGPEVAAERASVGQNEAVLERTDERLAETTLPRDTAEQAATRLASDRSSEPSGYQHLAALVARQFRPPTALTDSAGKSASLDTPVRGRSAGPQHDHTTHRAPRR